MLLQGGQSWVGWDKKKVLLEEYGESSDRESALCRKVIAEKYGVMV